MGLHRGYDNRNSREGNKNEIVLTKKLSLTGAPIDQNALRFSQMQYGLFESVCVVVMGNWCRQDLLENDATLCATINVAAVKLFTDVEKIACNERNECHVWLMFL